MLIRFLVLLPKRQLEEKDNFVLSVYDNVALRKKSLYRVSIQVAWWKVLARKTCCSGILRTGSFEVNSKMKGGGLSQ